MSDPTDAAADADDARCTTAEHRRRPREREPYCRFVDAVRAPLVRGTEGIGGRRGGTRDGAWGSAPPPLFPLREAEAEDSTVVGSGTPRMCMCMILAPSRVSSSAHGFDDVEVVDGVRATVGCCCQS
jgi:hypothetical protein